VLACSPFAAGIVGAVRSLSEADRGRVYPSTGAGERPISPPRRRRAFRVALQLALLLATSDSRSWRDPAFRAVVDRA
jgi:hypothetical protein